MYYAICGVSTRKLSSLQFPFHLICWGIPLVIVVVVASFRVEGFSNATNTGGWCWISDNAIVSPFFWELIGGKLVEWVSIACLVPACYTMRKKILRLQKARLLYESTSSSFANGLVERVDPLEEYGWKMVLMPLLFAFCRLWGGIRIILRQFGVASPTWLYYMQVKCYLSIGVGLILFQAAGDPSQGLLNCILFVFLSHKTRRLFKEISLQGVVFVLFSLGVRSERSSLSSINTAVGAFKFASESSELSVKGPSSEDSLNQLPIISEESYRSDYRTSSKVSTASTVIPHFY
jgi:hypothetical protein